MSNKTDFINAINEELLAGTAVQVIDYDAHLEEQGIHECVTSIDRFKLELQTDLFDMSPNASKKLMSEIQKLADKFYPNQTVEFNNSCNSFWV
ncbi:hypothetical protein QTV49_000500 [Vibrio vulnificus]|nr:hypothetical protein [Vibrio vulnificus]